MSNDTLPFTPSINGKIVETPLVSPSQARGHLGLLHAFGSLKATLIAYVGNEKAKNNPTMPRDLGDAWHCFVSLSVERFTKWCQTMQIIQENQRIEGILPPLDVLMVFHTYLLNPGWFHEDCLRVPECKELNKMAELMFSDLLQTSEILASEPSRERQAQWTKQTSLPFDPLESASQTTTKILTCPKCDKKFPAMYMSENGAGYFQTKFETVCPEQTCKLFITHDVLASAKLASDLVKLNEGKVVLYCLPGTVVTGANTYDVTRGEMFKSLILKAKKFELAKTAGPDGVRYASIPLWKKSILERSEYSTDKMKASMEQMMKVELKGETALLSRVMSAYYSDSPFSLNLVNTILRQDSFTAELSSMKWTDPQFFESSDGREALIFSVARYSAFLDLTCSNDLVPTLDIDLVWHTHLLKGEQYVKDVKKYCGKFIDHDDMSDENVLWENMDSSCRVWKDRFGISYTSCGCPQPKDKAASKLLSKFKSSTSKSLLPYLQYKDTTLAAVTHPSEHNAVYVMDGKAEKRREERKVKLAGRQKKSGEVATSEHKPAFFRPVSLEGSNASFRSANVVDAKTAGALGSLSSKLWKAKLGEKTSMGWSDSAGSSAVFR